MKLKTLLVATLAAITLIVSAPVANAQGGRQGGMRGMMRGGGSLMLLRRGDVKKDLKLTEKQTADLAALAEKMQTEMREMFQNGGGGDREAMMKTLQEKMATATKDAEAILTPEQKVRLEQINVQIAGNGIALDEKYAEKLKLTDDQKSKIKDLQTKQQEANRSIGEKMRNQEMEMADAVAAMQKNSDALNVEIGKLFTDEQKKLIASWAGPKFERDPADDKPRGFGGGGGF